ncbi:MAG TPA: aminotransferase class III-fold pyridoxal phosphate-dependent enzyme [Xanthomonadaceae bacterium]|nr:aminotransferase class III-fold pyridoxal phosphate-dependent enzyme [Xanthomonadaceae bacterium]
MDSLIRKLDEMRRHGGAARTRGLDDAIIRRFATSHRGLVEAVDEAYTQFQALKAEMPELLAADEVTQVHEAQKGFVNFYADDAINPYIALSARGPWIVTLKGAVLHDSGGYGMLGLGHAPKAVLEAMNGTQVMANIMTPSISHIRLDRALRREIGQRRGGCPYSRFLCLNSGSESVTLAGRIADVNVKLHTDPGGRHAGKPVRRIAVKGAFHGRTEHPALYSDSTRKTYRQHLAGARRLDDLIVVEPYDTALLRQAFADAEANGWFIEAVFLEPVMGEGDPGKALSPEFYLAARELTDAHGSLLLIDSIQAGLRAHGVLSIVDYPGFERLPAPDMETYSKALNAGQFPLSVLAVGERAAGLYRKGIYGNTMTSNPRAMDVAVAVLDSLTPELRANIVQRGSELLDRLRALAEELKGPITKVQGTGLLVSCELAPDYKCYGSGSTEEFMRTEGIGVIHGGANSLRFTPPFDIGSDEVALIVNAVRHALLNGPRKSQPEAAAA